MHEYPVTIEIIRIAEEHAKKSGSKKVKKINIVVGEYSGFVADSIQLYFDIMTENTLCDEAVLNITLVKPQLFCKKCNSHFNRLPFSFECPICGEEGSPTEIGREFYIDTIEL